MDRFLSVDDLRSLYELWLSEWPAPISLRGGGQLIRADMVRSIAFEDLAEVYGEEKAGRFKAAAEKYI